MKPQAVYASSVLTISRFCCVLVTAFAGLVCIQDSASGGMMTSVDSVTSVQVAFVIDGSETQPGGFSTWFENSIFGPDSALMASVSRIENTHSDHVYSGSSRSVANPKEFNKWLMKEWGVLAIGSLNTKSEAGFRNGLTVDEGNSIEEAIPGPRVPLHVPELNPVWRGTEYVFVPPAVPDDLLRPPQI
jgi:hypothetical protein